MRHLVKGRKLGRTPSHRKATLVALSIALIKEHRIKTTVAKAKELRTFIEPLITKAKDDTTHNRRQVFSKLNDKRAVSLLFDEVAKEAMDRPGGYTRVVKLGFRQGDNAEIAVIELVDYNDIKPKDSKKRSKTRRAGKSTSKNKSSSGSAKKVKEDVREESQNSDIDSAKTSDEDKSDNDKSEEE